MKKGYTGRKKRVREAWATVLLSIGGVLFVFGISIDGFFENIWTALAVLLMSLLFLICGGYLTEETQ